MNRHSSHDFFDEICHYNKHRIYRHMIKHNHIKSTGEIVQKSLCTFWNPYEKYHPDTGPLATYFNFVIHQRLHSRTEMPKLLPTQSHTSTSSFSHRYCAETVATYQNHFSSELDNDYFWKRIQSFLTLNQWKWVLFGLMEGMSFEKIAVQENTTSEAVKSWAKQTSEQLEYAFSKSELYEGMDDDSPSS